jgi:hypothetical protein
VAVTYRSDPQYPDILVANIEVLRLGMKLGAVVSVGAVQDELVWSPDSKAFFLNGNNNGYSDYHVAVHVLDAPSLGPGYITDEVEKDMAQSFPPCRAAYTPDNCAELAKNPSDYIGAAAVDWVGDSSRIVIMAEVAPSSSMGGIMGQVLGYEVDVPSGKIERRMTAQEFGRRWQHSMAWKFHIPGPPEYLDK